MMSSDEKILIIHDDPCDYVAGFRERFAGCVFETCRNGEMVGEALARVRPSIVFAVHGGRYKAFTHTPVLSSPGLKWLQNGGAGIDHLPAWDPAAIQVTNCRGVSSPFMAETVTGAVLMLNFGFPHYFEAQRRHEWAPHSWTSLAGKTVLVIGLGGIGSRVAARLKSFSMQVIGIRNSDKPCPDVDEIVPMRDLHDALPRADFVCIHVPNTPETRHLVDAEFLAAMKPSAYLINTARGAQVDELALIEALRQDAIAGAYLDVFASEPLPKESPLWDLPNLVISPHVSDAAAGWERNSIRFFTDNLERFLTGEPLLNLCDPSNGY